MKSQIKIAVQTLTLMAACLVIACNNGDPNPGKRANEIDTISQKNSTNAEAIAYKLDKDNGWGYKIIVNGKQFINQKEIPAIQGVKTFATEEDAKKVGDWIVGQIKRGEPFGVSDSLLKKLEIKY